MELLSQRQRGKWCQKPRRQTPLLGQEDGLVKVPLRGGDTFVTPAAHVWNGSAPLRQATTKAKAKKAASDFASLAPL
jgi:hypothetical protein